MWRRSGAGLTWRGTLKWSLVFFSIFFALVCCDGCSNQSFIQQNKLSPLLFNAVWICAIWQVLLVWFLWLCFVSPRFWTAPVNKSFPITDFLSSHAGWPLALDCLVFMCTVTTVNFCLGCWLDDVQSTNNAAEGGLYPKLCEPISVLFLSLCFLRRLLH